MKLMKQLFRKKRIFSQELNKDRLTWIEYRQQYLEENNIKIN